jgi:hypothetical protein
MTWRTARPRPPMTTPTRRLLSLALLSICSSCSDAEHETTPAAEAVASSTEDIAEPSPAEVDVVGAATVPEEPEQSHASEQPKDSQPEPARPVQQPPPIVVPHGEVGLSVRSVDRSQTWTLTFGSDSSWPAELGPPEIFTAKGEFIIVQLDIHEGSGTKASMKGFELIDSTGKSHSSMITGMGAAAGSAFELPFAMAKPGTEVVALRVGNSTLDLTGVPSLMSPFAEGPELISRRFLNDVSAGNIERALEYVPPDQRTRAKDELVASPLELPSRYILRPGKLKRKRVDFKVVGPKEPTLRLVFRDGKWWVDKWT